MKTEDEIKEIHENLYGEMSLTLEPSLGEGIKKIKMLLHKLAEVMKDAFRKLFKSIQNVFQLIKDDIYSLREQQSRITELKKSIIKLSFVRQPINHQIMNRKPRHLVRKIIR